MTVRVVTPSEPIVTLDEAKKHVRFSAPDDDAYLTSLVAAVTGYLDGPAGILGRALGAQVLEESRCDFPGFFWWGSAVPQWCRDDTLFIVRCPPILELQAITWTDDAGVAQPVDLATLAFDASSIDPGDVGWPVGSRRLGSVKVKYRAGYDPVPAPVRHAILLMVGTLYANREATPETAFAGAAAALLSPYQRVV